MTSLTSSILALALAPALSTQMDEPLSLSSMLVGNTAYAIMGALMLIALIGVPLRSLGVMAGTTRWLVKHAPSLWTRRAAPIADPDRLLNLAGLSPGLGRLAQHTRTLALELRRRSEEARHWPEDAADLEQVRPSWFSSLLTESLDFTPILDTRRAVFEWLQSVEGLIDSDREALSALGVDVDAVREILNGRQQVAELVRTLAGLMWAIDDRLADATTEGYRSTGYQSNSVGQGARVQLPRALGARLALDEDEDEHEGRARQRYFARAVGEHGRGISRMASSYTRGQAEHEDLEQDIALALWQSLPKFRGESTLKTFVYRVARYCCYRHIRRRGRLPTNDDALAGLGDPDSCIESRLVEADERAQVEEALAQLPDTLESTLSLHLEGMSCAEIAARLGISEGNVSVRLTRARHRLRALIAPPAAAVQFAGHSR